jgi:predicted dehydrogenase
LDHVWTSKSHGSSRLKGQDRVLRGAVIGLGNIALRGHLPAFRGDPGLRARAGIVAAVDLAAVPAEELLEGAKLYRDVPTLLAEEKLDFVDICTPPDSHAAGIAACAAAGLHILCEKPLAHTFEVVASVSRAVADAGIVFVPCHQYKYAPLWQAIHRSIEAGELGRIILARFEVLRTRADVGSTAWNPEWRTRKQHGGGGVLADTGAHYFYLARWLFGMPQRVAAVTRRLKHHEYGVEDTAAVTLEHEATIVRLDLTWAAQRRANAVHVIGTEGSLHYNGTQLVQVSAKGEREVPMPNVADKSQYVGWYAALAREFVRRVEAKDASRDLLEEAAAVMHLLDASYRAAAKETTVSIR